MHSTGRPGHLTALPEREQLVQQFDEALHAGAHLVAACAEADIRIRTHQCWTRNADVSADARPNAQRPTPAKKPQREAERTLMIATANEALFASLSPSQRVPVIGIEFLSRVARD